MTTKKKNTRIAILILILSLVLYFFLGKLKPEPEKNDQESKPPIVSTLILKKEEVKISVDSQGMVAPLIETILSAEISGTIVEISPKFLVGGIFSKDEILMRIDATTYQVALDQALALKDQRQNEFEDATKIRKQGYLSESDYLSAVTALAVAESGFVVAQRNLDKTQIRLPYDGMVKVKSADLGQYVNIGKQLGITFATNYAEIRLPLSDRDLVFADLPTSSEISGEGQFIGPEVDLIIGQSVTQKIRSGFIVRSEGVVDEKTRMTFAVARLEDPYNLKNQANTPILPVGTFVSARIHPKKDYEFIKIPRSAIINNRQVVLIDDENKIYYQDIVLVRTDKEFGYVIDGISDGQMISTTNLKDGINGMSIRMDQQ